MKDKNVRGTCLAIVSLTAFLASAAGTPQSGTAVKPPQPASTGTATPPAAASSPKVVLKVGATEVTESEIDSLVSTLNPRARAVVAAEGLRPVAEQYVRMLLLSRRALDEHLDLAPALRSRLELQRAETLAGAEYEKMSNEVKVSPEEVSQYFAGHTSEFETVQVREFLIRKRPQGSEDAKLGLSAEEAKAKAESIRKALLAGTDIDKVAEDFAAPNHAVTLIDRKPRAFRRAQMQPALEKATFDLQAGGVSEPVDTPQAFLVVKVFGHQHPELKEVATEIEAKLRQQKLDAEVDDLKKKASVWMDEDYFKGKPVATPGAVNQPPASPRP